MSIIVTARESIWSAQSTRSRPISIHEAIGSVAPSGDPVSAQACTIETTNASPTAAHATPPAKRSPSRRPNARLSSSPAMGRAIASGASRKRDSSINAIHLLLHEVPTHPSQPSGRFPRRPPPLPLPRRSVVEIAEEGGGGEGFHRKGGAASLPHPS